MSVLDEISPSVLEQWHQRVAVAVRVRQPSDIERIAEECAVAEWLGDRPFSVWHMAAQFYGTQCHCRACTGYGP